MTHPAVTAAPGSAVELSGAIAEEVVVVGRYSDLSGGSRRTVVTGGP